MQADVRMGERPVLGLFDSGPLVALCCAMYHTGVLVTRAAGSCSADNVWVDVAFVCWLVVLGGAELAVVCGWWP
jgi:hypothetical protein